MIVSLFNFGGDPERVFLVGESAGGGSVLHHLTRPKSFGLFHRAGIESGAYVLVDPQTNRSEYEAQFEALLNRSSCKDVAVNALKACQMWFSWFSFLLTPKTSISIDPA